MAEPEEIAAAVTGVLSRPRRRGRA